MSDAGMEAQLVSGLQAMAITASTRQVALLLSYLDLLQKWNRSFNLSGITDPLEMVDLHLLDSLTLLPYIKGARILDIGSGAGLPGIPLAILLPDTHFILMDSNGKKTRFLFQAKMELGIANVTVENNRIEHYQSRSQIDIVTCRAFSSLPKTIRMCEGLLAAGSRLLAMKGSYPDQEINDITPPYQVHGSYRVNIPGHDSERYIIDIRRPATGAG